MSRLTGNDAYGLMEAYSAVYQPRLELTEEQIWEEVENFVNELIEEGYDLSDYTWEEMYEAYIEERVITAQERGLKPAPTQPLKPLPQAEQVDVYDIILSHLLDEGYASSVDAAEAIMVNMSEDWRESIVEDIRGAITYNPNTPIGRLKRRIKGSTPEKREARTREYQGNKSDSPERFGGSQRAPYDDNRGDIPALRGK